MLKVRNFTPVLIMSLYLGNYPLSNKVVAEVPLQIAESTWKTFTSTEDGFSILMPIIPTLQTRDLKLNKSVITSKVFSVNNEDVVYGIEVRYYPAKDSEITIANPNGYFDLILSEIVSKYNILKHRHKLTLNGYPGQEFEVEMTTGTEIKLLKRRMYLVNNKMYIIGAYMPIGMRINLATSTSDFLNSFKLLEQ